MPGHLKLGSGGHLLMGSSGHLCITCCDGGGAPSWVQAVDCETEDLVDAWAIGGSFDPTKFYQIGGYCVSFTGPSTSVHPETVVSPSAPADACGECTPGPCPDTTSEPWASFLPTFLVEWPTGCLPSDELETVFQLSARDNGTYLWEQNPGDIGPFAVLTCEGKYWQLKYETLVAPAGCAGSVSIWRKPRVSEGFNTGSPIWELVESSLRDCCPASSDPIAHIISA